MTFIYRCAAFGQLFSILLAPTQEIALAHIGAAALFSIAAEISAGRENKPRIQEDQ